MQYGAMNFPVKPVLEEIEELHLLGFDYLELTMDPPMASPALLDSQREEIMSSLQGKGMGLICHLPTFLSISDLTESLRRASLEEMFHALEVAAALGAKKAVLHPGYASGMGIFLKDEVKKLSLESLEAIITKAERCGISLCLENMFPQSRSICELNEYKEVMKQFPKLRLTLDTGHANILSKGNKALDFIRAFGPRIGHVHASDNLGKEDNHLPIGTGTVDFPSILKTLMEVPYRGAITLEIFSSDRNYLRISREKLDAMLKKASG